MALPRVLVLDAEDLAIGQPGGHRFAAVARQLASSGLDVTLATVRSTGTSPAPNRPSPMPGLREIDVLPPDFPLVCGRGRALETIALRRSYAVAEQFGGDAFNAVIAPCRGGIAHGLLMRRATEPGLDWPAVALWCDASSRFLAGQDDIAPTDVGPLVADALEATALNMADLLLAPHVAAVDRMRTLNVALPPSRLAALPAFEIPVTPARNSSDLIEELVFVGPLSRANGMLIFMDAVERLAASGRLARRHVTFLGPAGTSPRGLGLELLGIQAANWPFRFRAVAETDQAKILEYLMQPGRLAVFAAEDTDDDLLLRAALSAGCTVLAGAGYDTSRPGGQAQNVCDTNADAWAGALQRVLDGGAGTTAPPAPQTDWRRVVEELLSAERRAPEGQRSRVGNASVGILHHGRDFVGRALASIATTDSTPTDVVVIDNASTPPYAADASSIAHRTMRFNSSLTQPAAYNRFASEAAGEVLIFLDDDNTFAPDGVGRLLRAFETGNFDIVVSTLDLVDGDPATDPSSGRFIFMGDAGLAGLFFNGFGDTAMAVRRDAFLRAGGFLDQGHSSAGLDWEFLARARAAGLVIGVLHEPAIRYSRRLGAQHHEWRKNDAEGIRRAVAAAYGTKLDATLLARFAQGLQLGSV